MNKPTHMNNFTSIPKPSYSIVFEPHDMPKKSKESETNLQKALSALRDQEKPNISRTAREFAVANSTLRRRWNGGKSLQQRPPNGRKLDNEQEKALCGFITQLDTAGIHVKPDQIAKAANSILASAHTDGTTPAPVIGDKWVKRFLRRYPEFHRRRRRALDIERKQALDKVMVEKWFVDYHQVIEERGIHPDDIYNFDETGFQIGVGKDQWIVTREPKKKLFSGSVTNRESVTVIECVSTDGFVCPPVVILSGKQMMLRWFAHLTDEHLAITESGYINDQLAFQWIQKFEKWTSPRTKGAWRMLFCDRFGSHLTLEFLEYCQQHSILPFFLPPHTSHILQPLDVGVFSVYKHWHSAAVEDASVSGCQKFTKDEFLYALGEIRRKTFKPSTIRLGWKLTGLWPINSRLITEDLIDYNPPPDTIRAWSSEPPTPSSHSSTSTQFSTLKTSERIRYISDQIDNYENTSARYQKAVQALQKGAKVMADVSHEIQSEIDRLDSVRNARHARWNVSRRNIRVTGIIPPSHAKKIKKNEAKLTELEAINKQRPKWKKVMRELKMVCKAKGILVR